VNTTVSLVELSAGSSHTCARTAQGAAYCWGSNVVGELGNGTIDDPNSQDPTPNWTPHPVVGGLTFVELAAGGNQSCGRTAAGQTYCWGSNDTGEFGNGLSGRTGLPTLAALGLTFVQLASGSSGSHMCGRMSIGTLYCWGANLDGQIGDGSTVARLTPFKVQLP
jgi:alpha-tubulin suppressor-like RCC1 family protein